MEMIKVEDNVKLVSSTKNAIIKIEKQIAKLKEQQDNYKKILLEEMEKQNILKYEDDDLRITYIAPSERETFDSKKLKKDNPELYDEYVKFSNVKASVRVALK